jgi:hypothetical protein
MIDENKFSHNRNRYDRPGFPYRCGRGVLWLKQCHQGPTIKGLCGGKTECSPHLEEDRWVCNRPKVAGGPCKDGPTLEGKCCKQHPPCVPKHNLKTYRKRLVILIVGVIFALICVSWMADQFQGNYLSFTPGPLSSSHIKFAERDGCQVCHESHKESAFNWLKASVTPVNISTKCGDCHIFGGPEFKAHNGDVNKHPQLQDTNCLMCHREHRGEKFSTRTFTNRQCNFCHKNQFKSFSKGHPDFSSNYPHSNKNSINFDHSTHLKKHFSDPKFSELAPENCMGCHKLMNEQNLQAGKFDVICAECHKSQILKKDLVLIRLPELDKNHINRKKIMEACGILDKNSGPQKEDEEFLSISTDTPTLTTSYLLNIPEDDPEGYSKKLQDLILALAMESTAPIADLIDEHSPSPIAQKMLAGLNPEVIKRAACAWGLNAEYDPPAEASFGGWHADLLEVRYTPVDHKDPVAMSWIEFALAVPSGETDATIKARAIAMRDQMLSSKDGVGGCVKCHAIDADSSEGEENNLSIHWGYKDSKSSPYLKFSHKSHLDVLGKGQACETCHVLKKNSAPNSASTEPDKKSDKEHDKEHDPENVTSNFNSINRNTCMDCHNKGKVRQDCQLCHLYHLEPGFKEKVLLAKNQPK